MKRSFKAFVVVSFLLNILLLAIIAGQQSRALIDFRPDHDVEEIASTLPPDKAALFIAAMSRAEDDNADLQQKLINARKQSANLLQAEPFDKKAYIDQFQIVLEIARQIKHRSGELVADLATQLSPQERAILAEGILKHRGVLVYPHKLHDNKKTQGPEEKTQP